MHNSVFASPESDCSSGNTSHALHSSILSKDRVVTRVRHNDEVVEKFVYVPVSFVF